MARRRPQGAPTADRALLGRGERRGLLEPDRHGEPLADHKQVYAQGFAIYGLAEWYDATGDEDALTLAWQLFDLIETHSRDAGHGGYIEAHARDWGPLADMALSERDLSVPKSMNTNLHVLEAYTNLLRVTGDERVRTALADLLRVCLDHIVVERSGRSPEPTWPDDWRRRARWARCGRRLAGLA